MKFSDFDALLRVCSQTPLYEPPDRSLTAGLNPPRYWQPGGPFREHLFLFFFVLLILFKTSEGEIVRQYAACQEKKKHAMPLWYHNLSKQLINYNNRHYLKFLRLQYVYRKPPKRPPLLKYATL